jgi:hypothetical protein
MNTRSLAEERLNHPRSQTTFRSVKLLVGCYLGISVLTLVAIILLRNNTAIVTPAVWIRGTIVVASALLTTSFAARWPAAPAVDISDCGSSQPSCWWPSRPSSRSPAPSRCG